MAGTSPAMTIGDKPLRVMAGLVPAIPVGRAAASGAEMAAIGAALTGWGWQKPSHDGGKEGNE
jgi:hypothetical protein